MYIRDLQSRVQYLRSDIPAGYADQALQDAARYVARKTGIVRKTVYGAVSAGQLRVDLESFMGAGSDFQILRPTEVMYMPGMDRNGKYKALLTATSLTIPAVAVATAWDFYVASVDLTASDGTKSYPMKAGDVIVKANGVWDVMEYWKYSVARDLKRPRLFRAQNSPMNSNGYISGYSVEKTSLLLTPVPVCDVAVSVECSIVPNKEFDTVDFPVEAEDAIIALASAQYLSVPNKSGGGADLARAQRLRLDGQGEISLVRALADGGYGDSEQAPPPRFGN